MPYEIEDNACVAGDSTAVKVSVSNIVEAVLIGIECCDE